MNLEFEYIVPWNGIKDTGKDVRLKLERNFKKIINAFKDVEDRWERYFVEKTDPQGQPYLFTAKPIVTAAGVTMYSGDTPYLPSMFEGIPLDGETLAWFDGKITVIGGIGQGGITGINVTGAGNAVTGASLSADGLTITLTKGSEFALKSDIPSLNGYATQSWVNTQLGGYATNESLKTVSDKLNNFLEGTDTDNIINKWKELEAFLSGFTETDTLASALSVKADKSVSISAGAGLTGGGTLAANRTLSLSASGVTVGTYTKTTVDVYGRVTAGSNLSESDIPSLDWSKIATGKPTTIAGYGITDVYTKTELNTTLGNYVTLAGAQNITGVKSFINGLKIGDITVKKHATGIVEIDGDLIVTGGVTMYAQGNHSASTILDALPIDADTLSKEGGVLSVIGGVGGGSVDGIILNGVTYSPNADTKLITLPNYPSIPSSLKNPYSITFTGYQSKTYDGSSAVSVAIPTTLPASDVYAWAKAANKPSYSYSEISGTPSSLKNPYSLTIQRHGVSLGSYDGSSAKTFNIASPTWGDVTGKPSWIGSSKPEYSWSEITGTLTVHWDNVLGRPAWVQSASKPAYAFSEIMGKPTTLAGYGITDAVTLHTTQTINNTKTFTANQRFNIRSIEFQNSTTGGSANGMYLYKNGWSAIKAGIGFFTANDGDPTMYIGWGDTPWARANNFHVTFTEIKYKDYSILHQGNYTNYLDGRYYTESEADARFVNASGDTMTGPLTIATSGDTKIILKSTDTDNYCIIAANNSSGNQLSYLGYAGNAWKIDDGVILTQNNFNTYTDSRYYYKSEADSRFVNVSGDTVTGIIDFRNKVIVNSSIHGGTPVISLAIGDNDSGFHSTGDGQLQMWADNIVIASWRNNLFNFTATPTAIGNTIWHAGNDGSGSGLDADLLDGVQYQNILERFRSAGQPQIGAAAWYRVGEFLGSNSESPQAIIMINRLYNSPANEGYTFAISLGYNGAISLTQLTGNIGGHLITQVRIDYTNSGKAYFDVYCGYTNYINWISVTSIGAFKTYNSNAFVVNPTVGSSSATYSTYNGVASNWGFTGNVSGNASSATKLQTARTINGTAFDGTANITTTTWGQGRYIGIVNSDGTGEYQQILVNGSGNINLRLPPTIKASITGNVTGNLTGNVTGALSGNATSATKLLNARTLWGRGFDGTGNVSGDMSNVGTILPISHNAQRIGSKSQQFNGLYAHFVSGGNTELQLGSNDVTRMWISTNGSVGIGISSPSSAYKLHVNGDIRADGLLSCGESADNAYGYVNVARPKSINACCFSFIAAGSFARGIGYTTGGDIWIGTPNTSKQLSSAWLTITGTSVQSIGDVKAKNGYLISVSNDKTITIGSQNSTYCHYSTTASQHWFNSHISVNGNIYPYGTGRGIGEEANPFDTIYIKNWFRSVGQTGWYSETYGGGIYMIDNTYLRVHGGKSFYVPGNILATGGVTMYGSDVTKKDVISHVLLPLDYIARAPLWRYRWNDRRNDRMNVGGSAQYTQMMLGELVGESDKGLVMDYATTAYAFSVCTARHFRDFLDNEFRTHETEIDKLKKENEKMKRRIEELERRVA